LDALKGDSRSDLPFKDVLDVVLKDKDVGLGVPRDANKIPVVVLDPSGDFLVIEQLHDDGSPVADQVCEIPRFCVGLLFDMMRLQNRVRNAVAPSSVGVTAPISPAHGCLLTFDKQQKMIDSLALSKDRHAHSIMIRGISTHLFAAGRLDLEQLEAAVCTGFERIEIFALKPHFDYQNRQLTSKIASWFSDHDCLLHSIHTPFSTDYQAGGGSSWLSIGDLEKSKREKALDEIRWALELAEKIPLSYAIVHMGSPDDPYTLKHLDAIHYSLEILIQFARDRGVSLALENIPNQLSPIEKILRFLEQTQLAEVGICFDSGHSNLLASAAEEIEIAGKRIVTTHLHDNHGQKDEHLLPFEGSISWPGVLESFDKINYQGCLLLELKAENRDPFDVLKLAFQSFDRFKKCQDELAEMKSREE
jgi:sugar phosphate isomerase/epimerase